MSLIKGKNGCYNDKNEPFLNKEGISEGQKMIISAKISP